jgi:hypothetical protein
MRSFVALGLTLVGCAYQAGSFRTADGTFAGVHTTVDCLDLAIERRADLATGDAVLAYAFGNRCDHPATVDLADVAVYGRTEDGHTVELTAFDPGHEIATLQLDGRETGREAIAYQTDAPLRDVCIDAASVTHASPARWVCFPTRPQLSEVP